jgi:hypothetical protein
MQSIKHLRFLDIFMVKDKIRTIIFLLILCISVHMQTIMHTENYKFVYIPLLHINASVFKDILEDEFSLAEKNVSVTAQEIDSEHFSENARLITNGTESLMKEILVFVSEFDNAITFNY